MFYLVLQITLIIFMICSMITIILVFIQTFFSSLFSLGDNQVTPIESGFEALKCSSFISSSFFLLAVLFVLFDLELILLLPIIFHFITSIFSTMIIILLIMFISLTLLWEWWLFGLKWSS